MINWRGACFRYVAHNFTERGVNVSPNKQLRLKRGFMNRNLAYDYFSKQVTL